MNNTIIIASLIVILVVVLIIILFVVCRKEKEGLLVSKNDSGSVGISCSGTLLPVGTIVAYEWIGNANDSKIPDGWGLCNGDKYNGITTPNLQENYLLGTGSDGVMSQNSTSGKYSKIITEDQVPLRDHTHPFGFKYTQSGTNGGTESRPVPDPNSSVFLGNTDGVTGMQATVPLSIQIPDYIPSYSLVFIMYVGGELCDNK